MTLRIKVTKTVTVPDRMRLARLARVPELGPGILFFSGGSAINPLSRVLTNYTHNSIHLITTFDSGGSSAKLRKAFGMPAVGDLRNRLMALADQTVKGNPEVRRLFAYRLPKEAGERELKKRLEALVAGKDPLIASIPDPLRKIVRNHLGYFQKAMPLDFDLRGASIGNLVLTGGYLNNDHHLDPVVYLFAKLAEARGIVRPILNRGLHLAAELEDGRLLIGQHLLTGREVPPITSPIKRIFLSESRREAIPVNPPLRNKVKELIDQAELICYPMGSFYSSLTANLLPQGVTEAIAGADCPKVYIPNTGRDLEFPGGSVTEMVKTLIHYLHLQTPEETRVDKLLNFVVIDSEKGQYPERPNIGALKDLGVSVIDTRLVKDDTGPYLDPELLTEVLLSLF